MRDIVLTAIAAFTIGIIAMLTLAASLPVPV